jgi:hypothetical protein
MTPEERMIEKSFSEDCGIYGMNSPRVLLSDALVILSESLKLQRLSCANAWAEYKAGDYKTIWANIINAPEV